MAPQRETELLLFGSTGDLARRKLMPALYRLHRDGHARALGRIVALGRSALSTDDYLQQLRQALPQSIPEQEWSEHDWQAFSGHIRYVSLDAENSDDYARLARTLSASAHTRVFYLATTPALYGRIAEELEQAGLVRAIDCRLVLEKPLGHDLQSCRQIHRQIRAIFPEKHLYRVDHYLGKEAVQNLLALRFGNSIFHPLWSNRYVDSIQITVAESVGMEGRVEYYTGTGALRDMVQNHLLQMLCMVALEPPPRLDPELIHDEKMKVLESLVPITTADAPGKTVRGCYQRGVIDGETVPGIAEEAGDLDVSNLETYVALRADLNNSRWAGVPFYLRTGKRLSQGYSEIVIRFSKRPFSLFPRDPHDQSDRLVIRLQPHDTMTLHMVNKRPGLSSTLALQPVALDLTSSGGGSRERTHDAYEKLLLDLLAGDPTFFARDNEVEAAWRWIDTIIEAWRDNAMEPRPYTAGTMGPDAASALIERDGRSWHEQ